MQKYFKYIYEIYMLLRRKETTMSADAVSFGGKVGNIGYGAENGDKQSAKALKDILRETDVFSFAEQNPNVNILTSGASIW